MKIRLSKKFVFLLSGALVLCGASGSAAVLIGTDKILGPSYKDINGLTCTTLQTQKMRRDGSIWVRKYVTSDQSGDGISRLKTALRVARAVQEKEKAGLVQVAMIDMAGPKDTAEMRGRAIAAQVVYIPDPSKMPTGAQSENYSGYYLDGAPGANGHFYGMRVDLPLEDIEHLEAHLTDKADCFDPSLPEGGEAAKATSGHGAPAGGSEKASGHGAAPSHGAAPETEGAGAEAEAKGEEVAAVESGGFLSSITGMIFGAKEEAAGGHGDEKAAVADKAGVAADADHGEQAAKSDSAAAAEKPVEAKSFLDQAKSMILGDTADKPAEPAQTEAKADAKPAPEPAEPAREPRTTAEGGKGWSKSDAADEIHSGSSAESEDHQKAAPKAAQAGAHSAAQPEATGTSAADAAGAAWLEKFRAQQAAPGAPPVDGAKPTH